MAGSASTITYMRYTTVKRIQIDWTSDNTTGAVTAVTEDVFGQIQRVVFDPGSPTPTGSYDVLVNDEYGIDLCEGSGADRSASAVSVVNLTNGSVAGKLTVVVTNAGNSKQGTIYIYYR